MNERKRLITFSIVFWIVVNLASLAIFSEETSRWVRFICTAFFLVTAILHKPFYWKLFFAFLLFTICDFSLIYFENPVFNTITFISRGVAFIFVAAIGAVKLKRLRITWLEFFIGVILVAINLTLLIELESLISFAHTEEIYISAFYIFSVIAIFTIIIAVSYSNRYNNKKSFFYLCAVLWMICSDLTYFIAYYLDFPEFYYADRFFNVLGSGFLMLFASTSNKKRKLLDACI
ncbi:hypothetical protein [Zunongwangia pacifica]|uniref:YhhN-like protein n=1 Tax=Zunongwangia pacifica TaxID=2911062 RepID=A0A9X1ZSI1_9FLAO|nr:hypothetical protein [Zunongwangia pacifica]MCL6217663.1 hypothetical protein [Zunongwangia pacifica]